MNPKNPYKLSGEKAEYIAKEMYEKAGFEVFDFGYEHAFPRLAELEVEKAKQIGGAVIPKHIRFMPDLCIVFPVGKKQKLKANLIEVKRREKIDMKDVVKEAKKYESWWPEAILLYVTDEGFFFGYVKNLSEGKSVMKRVPEKTVSKKIQDEMLKKLLA